MAVDEVKPSTSDTLAPLWVDQYPLDPSSKSEFAITSEQESRSPTEGLMTGLSVGRPVASLVGLGVGLSVGTLVGREVGLWVEVCVGPCVGVPVLVSVGLLVGLRVGEGNARDGLEVGDLPVSTSEPSTTSIPKSSTIKFIPNAKSVMDKRMLATFPCQPGSLEGMVQYPSNALKPSASQLSPLLKPLTYTVCRVQDLSRSTSVTRGHISPSAVEPVLQDAPFPVSLSTSFMRAENFHVVP
mmetsp:Transcript_81410/g.217730  ORF Transcript_81410/g.217730 Transcript_81410/m.217730 type:complete len:241 (+) Transcript_81410:587-1309(+)